MKDKYIKKLRLNLIAVVLLPITLLSFAPASALQLDLNKFYTLSPSPNSTDLWSIDPATAATTHVTSLTLPGGETPNFMTNALTFSPDNELFGWDTANKQLYKVDYSAGQINYIGSPGSESTPAFVNGLTFNSQGNLYGQVGGNINGGSSSTASLYSINTTTGALTQIQDSYVKTTHNGLAVNTQTDQIYSITGIANTPNHLLRIDPDPQPIVNETHTTNTTGSYNWTYKSSTSYSYGNNAIHMDGYSSSWTPAYVAAERTEDISSSGHATIDFNLTLNGEGQSRLFFFLKEDEDSYYKFAITDTTYGGSSWTQGIEKVVNGVSTDWTALPGSLDNTGSYTMDVWWNPTNLRMDLNGVTIQDIATTDQTILDPSSFMFKLYRFVGDWEGIDIEPGYAEIIGDLGINFAGIGAEFAPGTGNLYTVRDTDTLYSVDINTGIATEVGLLGNDLNTVNLAAPWQTVVPEPLSSLLFITGGTLLGLRRFRKS